MKYLILALLCLTGCVEAILDAACDNSTLCDAGFHCQAGKCKIQIGNNCPTEGSTNECVTGAMKCPANNGFCQCPVGRAAEDKVNCKFCPSGKAPTLVVTTMCASLVGKACSVKHGVGQCVYGSICETSALTGRLSCQCFGKTQRTLYDEKCGLLLGEMCADVYECGDNTVCANTNLGTICQCQAGFSNATGRCVWPSSSNGSKTVVTSLLLMVTALVTFRLV